VATGEVSAASKLYKSCSSYFNDFFHDYTCLERRLFALRLEGRLFELRSKGSRTHADSGVGFLRVATKSHDFVSTFLSLVVSVTLSGVVADLELEDARKSSFPHPPFHPFPYPSCPPLLSPPFPYSLSSPLPFLYVLTFPCPPLHYSPLPYPLEFSPVLPPLPSF